MSNQVPPEGNSDWENPLIQIQEVLPSVAMEALLQCQNDPKTLPCGRPLPKPYMSKKKLDLLLETMTQKLDSYVRGQNLKKTAAREKVLKTIVYEARHFRVQDLLVTLRKYYPEMGQATLYRTLPILVESGILQEGPMDPNGQIFYELAEHEHHDHILCLDCQRIFEFQDEYIETRQNTISKESRFKPMSHRHVIFAKCEFQTK